jgi:TPR repeat protein
MDWLLKSASQGYAPAQSKIGWYYYDGHFVKRDLAKAFEWFNKSAQQSDPNDDGMAEGMLGAMYQTGDGAPLDHALAMKWLFKSAEHGNAQSMFELGAIYEKGAGEAVDFGKAVTWYQKAAEAGNADAKKRLGKLQARSQSAQSDARSKLPASLELRCFLEADVDSLRDNIETKKARARHDECLRSNWKRLYGSTPFPLDR